MPEVCFFRVRAFSLPIPRDHSLVSRTGELKRRNFETHVPYFLDDAVARINTLMIGGRPPQLSLGKKSDISGLKEKAKPIASQRE